MVWVWWIDVVSVRCCRRSQVSHLSTSGRPLDAFAASARLIRAPPVAPHPSTDATRMSKQEKKQKKELLLWGAWGTADGRAGRGVLLHCCPKPSVSACPHVWEPLSADSSQGLRVLSKGGQFADLDNATLWCWHGSNGRQCVAPAPTAAKLPL